MIFTAVIQIGNSDDKLSQEEWSRYVSDVQDIFIRWNFPIHFHGCSVGSAPWQNACWVVEVAVPEWLDFLRTKLAPLAKKYSQESIALTVGKTEFVPATN